MDKSGTRANRSGNQLERFVRWQLESNAYCELDKKVDFLACNLDSSQPAFSYQYHLGENIYGHPRVCDFIIYRPHSTPDFLLLECKWQNTSGSVDEKFPYLVENIRLTGQQTGISTLVILDGGGYRLGAERWLRAQRGGFLYGVCSMSELQNLANQNFF